MSAIYPPGIILPYAGPADKLPTGWLLCDGAIIPRASYSDLFDIIKNIYGATGDTATFKLPDLRGRVVAGVDSMLNTAGVGVPPSVTPAGRLTNIVYDGVNGSALGESGGAQSHLLLSSESGMRSHTHLTYAAKAGNTSVGGGQPRLTGLAYDFEAGRDTGQTSAVAAANASAAHNNVQPTIVLNYMIKI